MHVNLFYLFAIFMLINIRSFALMYKDKRRAIRNDSTTGAGRISEASLFKNALMLGFMGIGVAMVLLRHKIRKPSFTIGIPIIAIAYIVVCLFLKEKLVDDYAWDFYFSIPEFKQ